MSCDPFSNEIGLGIRVLGSFERKSLSAFVLRSGSSRRNADYQKHSKKSEAPHDLD
jgi:hypothetical protein